MRFEKSANGSTKNLFFLDLLVVCYLQKPQFPASPGANVLLSIAGDSQACTGDAPKQCGQYQGTVLRAGESLPGNSFFRQISGFLQTSG
jgi:hypothetical protein